jgi:cytochrome P450
MATEPSRRAPGPRPLPLIGNLLSVYQNPLPFFMRVSAEHGDVVGMTFGPYRYYLVNDVGGIHRVLVENAKNYTKSRNYQGLKLVLGDGLVTSEGDFWRRQRRLAQPAFHRDRLAAFAQTMADDTASMLAQWAPQKGKEIDVHAEMMALTLRIVARTLFSTVVGAEAEAIGRALSIAIHFANDYAEAMVRLPRWLPTPANVRFTRAVKTLDELVFRIIDERRKGTFEVHDLLAMLMSAMDDTTRTGMTDRQLRDEVMTLVMAGHETTANALTWTWYLLSKAPEIERRLHAEVASVLGGRRPTIDDLPKLRYTAMVIQEAMRLYPPVWAFERQAIEDDVIAGYAIPARSIIAVSPYALHRHRAHWENPEGFDPARFTPERIAERAKYAYLPFGGGPRLCIGNGFAMMEAQIILAMVVQRHRLALVPGRPVEAEPVITLRPKRGLPMTLLGQAPEAYARDMAAELRPGGAFVHLT